MKNERNLLTVEYTLQKDIWDLRVRVLSDSVEDSWRK
jgi:hypothetical protein